MINFPLRRRAREARLAQREAEIAAATERAARARAEAARLAAEANALEDRAAVAARERELKAAIRLRPLETEAARIEAEAAEAERVRLAAAREAQNAAEAEQAAARAAQRAERLRMLTRRRLVAAAFSGVSVVAVGGQSWAYCNGAGWWLPAAIAVACVVETIGLALGYLWHEALLDDQPAGGLQVASYLVALYVAMINYWHWSADWSPTPESALFAACSAAPPMLWAAQAKRTYAAKRKAEGRPLPRAPRYGLLRWALWREDTFGTVRLAIRTGESDPHAAAIAYDIERASAGTGEVYAAALDELATWRRALDSARLDLIAVAEAHRAELEAHEAQRAALEAKRRRTDDDEDDGDANVVLPEVPSPERQEAMSAAELAEAAQATVRAARLAGIKVTGRMLGESYNRGERWGQIQIARVGPFVVAGEVDSSGDERAGNG